MLAFRYSNSFIFAFLVWCCAPHGAQCQTVDFRSEASTSGVWSDVETANGQYLVRYLPEVSLGFPLNEDLFLDASVSANLWLSRGPSPDGPHSTDSGSDAYRAWVRLSAPQFELRAGLQKISFGSATLFRPLMWFDRIDPRDPLQLTEGVWGLLGRMYLPGNITAWGWVLAGDEERKGWEVIPSLDGAAEGGGRLQVPFGPGEAALTYHHRRFDVERLGLYPAGAFRRSGDEDRVAFDAKWDLGIGLWTEVALIRQRSQALEEEWSGAFNVGMDYTFDLGNGLTVLGEYIVKENPSFVTLNIPDDSPPGAPGPGGSPPTGTEELPAAGPSQLQLTSVSANYPVGVLDRVSLAVYRDWESSNWFRLLEWRRTYDRWRVHVLAFWNPDEGTFFPAASAGQGANSGSLTGRGAQLIVVFNH